MNRVDEHTPVRQPFYAHQCPACLSVYPDAPDPLGIGEGVALWCECEDGRMEGRDKTPTMPVLVSILRRTGGTDVTDTP